jgi:hypothetical protein
MHVIVPDQMQNTMDEEAIDLLGEVMPVDRSLARRGIDADHDVT